MKLNRLSTRCSLFFRWYDLWIGAYYDTKSKDLYICPLPMIGIKIYVGDWIRAKHCLFGHNYSGWTENLKLHATGSRYRMCLRCDKIEIGQ